MRAAIKNEFQGMTHKKNYGLEEIRIRMVRIKFLRASMFGVGLLSALSFLGFSILSSVSDMSSGQKELIAGDALVISKPRFIGHSSSGGKITITAEKATRAIGSEGGVVELETPHMVSEDGANVSAKTGMWDQNQQILRLKEEVVMVYTTGDKVHSQSAYWGQGNPNDPPPKGNQDISLKEAAQASPTRLWLAGNVHFIRPSGETIDGKSAIWDSKIGRLSLTGDVVVNMKNGIATSQLLALETNSRVVKGSGGISISLPMGIGTAQSYEFYPDSNRLILRGGARVVFNK